jgi:3-methylcrotonyl-CoA carboxylase alpha subunit
MIAKLIAHGATRDVALTRLTDALAQTVVAGPRTNVSFLAALSAAPEFRRGGVDTGFIDRNLVSLGAAPLGIDKAAAARGIARLIEREMERLASAANASGATVTAWDASDGFQLIGPRIVPVRMLVDGEAVTATASFTPGGVAVEIEGAVAADDTRVIDAPDAVYVLRAGRQTVVRRYDVAETAAADPGGDGAVRAPMHGKVLAVLIEPGATVHKGQRLAVVEAMKMEHALTAPIDGTVAEVAVVAGGQVAEGALVLRIDARAGEGG